MNTAMWSKPVVARNVATLREDGFLFVDPEEGWLSCRQRGVGRMASPETILTAIGSALSAKRPD
jgi:phosphopantothenoylcysteine decarboxylase/phosphopantothenate--cysteine ligase